MIREHYLSIVIIAAGMVKRGGPKKSDSGLSEDSALIRGESRMNRSKANETTPPQSLSGLRSQGSTDGDQGRTYPGAAGRALRCASQPDHSVEGRAAAARG